MSDLAARVDALHERALARRKVERETAAAAAVVKAASAEQRKAELRETMPKVAASVDDLRRVFGAGVQVIAALENGRSVVNRAACQRIGVDVRVYERD